jgi:hypothetical protein
MKRLLFVFLSVLCFAAPSVHGQTSVPSPNVLAAPYTIYGQMLNLSNTHPGQRNDTLTSTGYLSTAYFSNSTNLPVKYPAFGSGPFSLQVAGLKASTVSTTTATIQVTPEGSFDGVTWASIPGVTTATLSCTSRTVAVTSAWSWSENYFNYYRVKGVVGADTISLKAYWGLNKKFVYNDR